jgi:chromosome segregation ATPase
VPGISICFDPEKKEWFYREDWSPLYGDRNPLDDVLDYKALRKMEYPQETDYLDAQTKADESQLLAYYEACRKVKARYPKDFVPITRRDYLVKTIGLRTDKETTDFEFGTTTATPNRDTLSTLKSEVESVRSTVKDEVTTIHDGLKFIKEDLDTLKVARTLAKGEITKLKKEIQATNKRLEDLPAYEVATETERIKAQLSTTNDRLTTLQNSLDSVIAVLKRRYIM